MSEPVQDRLGLESLRESSKEKAELLMIVDLERNDLGRVCRPGSIRVSDLRRMESFAQVHHAVATIEGQLDENRDAIDALRACFPGGSITGAPKIRAMEIIRELEPVRRGVYTGSIGYLAPDGSATFNIAIRTLIVKDGRAHFHVGSGIVADSDPAQEYDETIHKARGIMMALSAMRQTAS
jgi:para-aminobenzoate synthetase component 1